MTAALDSLEELARDHVILVEGAKDERALRSLGIQGEFFHVQSSGGPVRAAEHVWSVGGSAVIMTDWDRRGDSLADDLRINLRSLGVAYDDSVRSELSRACGKYCMDVESLDSVKALLERNVCRLI